MEDKEIQERNREISLMLGWIDSDGDLIIPLDLSRGTDYCEWADTKNVKRDDLYEGCVMNHYINVPEEFYYNWNWLMEGVKKVLSILNEDGDWEPYDTILDQIPDHEATFIAVSNFAKLYNNKI